MNYEKLMQSEQLGFDTKPTPLALAPSEAARVAGIGRTKLYEAISSGALPSFKIGTRRLIRLSALDDWLASFEDKAP